MKKSTFNSIGICCSILTIIISIVGQIRDFVSPIGDGLKFMWIAFLICGVSGLLACIEERKKKKKEMENGTWNNLIIREERTEDYKETEHVIDVYFSRLFTVFAGAFIHRYKLNQLHTHFPCQFGDFHVGFQPTDKLVHIRCCVSISH